MTGRHGLVIAASAGALIDAGITAAEGGQVTLGTFEGGAVMGLFGFGAAFTFAPLAGGDIALGRPGWRPG